MSDLFSSFHFSGLLEFSPIWFQYSSSPDFFLVNSHTSPPTYTLPQPHPASHCSLVQIFHSSVPAYLLLPLQKETLVHLCFINPTHFSRLSYEDLQLLQNSSFTPSSVFLQLNPIPYYGDLLMHLPSSGASELKKDRGWALSIFIKNE